MIPTLETERLILRAHRAADFEPFAAMMAEPQVARFITLNGEPQNRADSWRILAALIGGWTLRGFGMWAVEERATGRYLGRVGPWQPEGWPGFEIGWGLNGAAPGLCDRSGAGGDRLVARDARRRADSPHHPPR